MAAYILGVLAAMGVLAAAVLSWRRARRTLARLCDLSVPQPADEWAAALLRARCPRCVLPLCAEAYSVRCACPQDCGAPHCCGDFQFLTITTPGGNS